MSSVYAAACIYNMKLIDEEASGFTVRLLHNKTKQYKVNIVKYSVVQYSKV